MLDYFFEVRDSLNWIKQGSSFYSCNKDYCFLININKEIDLIIYSAEFGTILFQKSFKYLTFLLK
jgi:hypothetical protein